MRYACREERVAVRCESFLLLFSRHTYQKIRREYNKLGELDPKSIRVVYPVTQLLPYQMAAANEGSLDLRQCGASVVGFINRKEKKVTPLVVPIPKKLVFLETENGGYVYSDEDDIVESSSS